MAERRRALLRTFFGELPEEHRRLVEDGGHGFYGIRGFFEWLEKNTYKVHVRVFLARYRAYRPCPACRGSRLRPDALAVRHGLTDEERARLKARDMGWLYMQGVHPYILAQFALSIRYDMAAYARQVREATGYRDAAQ